MEEATFLTRYASKVTVVHRRDEFRASQIMLDARAHQPEDRVRDERTSSRTCSATDEGVGLRDTETARPRSSRSRRLHRDRPRPEHELFVDQLDHDENGYIVTRPGSTRDELAGVFAAGDVQDHVYRQAVTAAGTGCMAALDAERFLAAEEGHEGTVSTAAHPEAAEV